MQIEEFSAFHIQVSIKPCNCLSQTQGAVDYISINVSYSIPKEWDDINADKRSPGKKPTTTYEKKRVLYQGMVLSNSFISHSREPEYSLYMYNGEFTTYFGNKTILKSRKVKIRV